MKALIEKLERQRTLSEAEFVALIEGRNEEMPDFWRKKP